MSKQVQYKYSLMLLIGCLVTAPAMAGKQCKGINGYVTAASGELARDSDGHCIRAGSWTPADAIPECEGGVKKKKVVMKVAPAQAPVSVPVAEPQPVYKTYSLGAGALFDTNKQKLKAEGVRQIDALITHLKSSANYETIEVTGHTDSRGRASYNQALSERRANAVRDYLVKNGIPANKITASGKGESAPIASNASKEGRQKNRRVEIRVKASKRVK